jgi:hypothetical protein
MSAAKNLHATYKHTFNSFDCLCFLQIQNMGTRHQGHTSSSYVDFVSFPSPKDPRKKSHALQQTAIAIAITVLNVQGPAEKPDDF